MALGQFLQEGRLSCSCLWHQDRALQLSREQRAAELIMGCQHFGNIEDDVFPALCTEGWFIMPRLISWALK